MKRNFILMMVILIGIFLLSCKGDVGPAGAPGEDGKPLYVKMFQYDSYPTSSYQAVYDNYIQDASPTNNYGECNVLILANASGNKSKVLIRFDNLNNFIPANATITNANLVLYGFNFVTYTASSISAYKLTRSWTEGTGGCGGVNSNSSWLNYSGSSSWTNPGGDFDAIPVSDAVRVNTYLANHTLKLKPEVVKEWIKSPTTNYGVLIKATDETKAYAIGIAASESVSVTLTPKLAVYYTIS